VNCWRIQNLVAPFLDGVLSSEEESSIAEHLEDCSECNTLVEGVATLPDLPYSELSATLEGPLFKDFDARLADRIEDSVISAIGSSESESQAGGEAQALGLAAFFGLRGGTRLSPVLVGTYLAVLGLLAGGIAWNYLQVEKLEASLEQRDEIISTLQQRLVTLDLEREAGFGFSADSLSTSGPMFMPAAAPQALPVAPRTGFQGRGRGGLQSSPYQQVSLDGLRVIH